MVKWFNNGKNAEEMYKKCESAGGGYYPVGKNNMWHSGVHFTCNVTEETAVYPIISGKVVAKRLGDYQPVDKPESIHKSEYFELTSAMKKNYKIPTLLSIQTYLKSKEEYDDEYGEEDNKAGYNNGYSAKYKYSNSFVLLEHECFIGQVTPFKFYTLYMNLEGIENEKKGKFLVPNIGETITPAIKLGRPGKSPSEDKRFYDFAVFFPKDKSFMNLKKKINDNNEYCFYSIDSSIVRYTGVEPTQTKTTFHVGAELPIREIVEVWNKTVYKIKKDGDDVWILYVTPNCNIDTSNNRIYITGVANTDVTIPTYSVPPFEFTAPPTTVETKADKSIEVRSRNRKEQLYQGQTYYHFAELGQNEGKDLYISKADMEKSKRNGFSWDKYFNKIEERSNKDDLYFNLSKIMGEDLFRALPWLAYQTGTVFSSEILEIFNPELDSDPKPKEDIKKFLRKIVCIHPLEWEKELYADLQTNYKNYWHMGLPMREVSLIEKIVEAIDIWGVLKGKEGFSENLFWFAHPVYFIDYLDKAGLLEYNPYAMEVVKPLNAKKHGDPEAITVKSCPGFATIRDGEADTSFPISDNTNSNIHWAGVNYVFGKSNAYSSTIPHNGLDLASKASPRSEFEPGSPIASMIFGKVWAVTWRDNMKYGGSGNKGTGRVMIIKDMNKPIVYKLAHLYSCRKKTGDSVYPGEIVARAGNIGNSSAEHLHLEVFECTKTGDIFNENINDVLSYDKYKNKPYEFISADPTKQSQYTGLTWQFKQIDQRRNPFDHSQVIPE